MVRSAPSSLSVAGTDISGYRGPVPETLRLTDGDSDNPYTPNGPRIVWEADGGSRASDDVAASLSSFIRLRGVPDAAYLAFAQRWGPLGLCPHGRPWNERTPHCGMRPSCESIGDWARYAWSMWGLMRVAARVHSGRPASVSEWGEALEHPLLVRVIAPVRHGVAMLDAIEDGRVEPDRVRSALNDIPGVRDTMPELWRYYGQLSRDAALRLAWERGAVALCAAEWLNATGVRFDAGGHANALQVGLRVDSRAAALAVQLAAAVTSPVGVAFCDGCDEVYETSRRPQAGRRRYCRDCRMRSAPKRDWWRARRAGRPAP